MKPLSTASELLVQEAGALLTRLARVTPFSLIMTMTPAAMPSAEALQAIEQYLVLGRHQLRDKIRRYIRWLRSSASRQVPPAERQRRYAVLKMLFNRVLTQFDLFADVLTQRSEHKNGVWLAGLDVVATDAINLPGRYLEAPPLICYLSPGYGAAIRRAGTRLPGGGKNPVTIIRVPRERMVGSGISASLIHEVGHQGAVLLGLIDSLRAELRKIAPRDPDLLEVWPLWSQWISEIIADYWAIAHLGIGSTLGLIGVMSLPRAFVFRVNPVDPHPIPWIRVKLSCAMGQALFPDPQWARVNRIWDQLYPLSSQPQHKQDLFRQIEDALPDFVRLLLHHRPRSLHDKRLREVFPVAQRQPARLRSLFRIWSHAPTKMRRQPPSLVLAVIGQAKADQRLSPTREGRTLVHLLNYWALRDVLSLPAQRLLLDRETTPLAV